MYHFSYRHPPTIMFKLNLLFSVCPDFFATATEVPLFVVIDNVNVSQLPATARAHSMIVP
jgi:hypothetical protein